MVPEQSAGLLIEIKSDRRRLGNLRPMGKTLTDKQLGKGAKAAPIQDLREWLSRVETLGELVRVRQPVNRDEEMSAISYLVAKQTPSPAVLFEHASGFESGVRLLWNILGPSRKRIALTL